MSPAQTLQDSKTIARIPDIQQGWCSCSKSWKHLRSKSDPKPGKKFRSKFCKQEIQIDCPDTTSRMAPVKEEVDWSSDNPSPLIPLQVPSTAWEPKSNFVKWLFKIIINSGLATLALRSCHKGIQSCRVKRNSLVTKVRCWGLRFLTSLSHVIRSFLVLHLASVSNLLWKHRLRKHFQTTPVQAQNAVRGSFSRIFMIFMVTASLWPAWRTWISLSLFRLLAQNHRPCN